MSLDELETKTRQWAYDRDILTNGKSSTQLLKLVEEVGELANAFVRDNREGVADAIGDCLVVLTNFAALEGMSVGVCWNAAWEEIKDRKGTLLPNGNFVKEEDYDTTM